MTSFKMFYRIYNVILICASSFSSSDCEENRTQEEEARCQRYRKHPSQHGQIQEGFCAHCQQEKVQKINYPMFFFPHNFDIKLYLFRYRLFFIE